MLDFSAIDPNIVYIVLVLGLWTTVTAVYVSGTLVLEGLAAGALFFSGLALLNMPTQWLAALVLLVGVGLFVVTPFLKREVNGLTVAGLGLQALGGFFLFEPPLSVSVLVLALSVVVPYLYNHYVLLPMIHKALTNPVYDRDNTLVGQRGRVDKALDPVGTVQVGGELWTATTDDGETVPTGEHVIVLERTGLQLIVEAEKHKRREHDADRLEKYPDEHPTRVSLGE